MATGKQGMVTGWSQRIPMEETEGDQGVYCGSPHK